jgi:hypothetical protein
MEIGKMNPKLEALKSERKRERSKVGNPNPKLQALENVL